MTDATDLPTYVCHKRVRAAEVAGVDHEAAGTTVWFVDHVLDPMRVHHEHPMISRYRPVAGDFLVVYEDGYQSFSPRKAFLEGYSLAHTDSVLMERLNDVAMAGPGIAPTWLQSDDWAAQLARVAREAYVTINSLKQQIELLQKEFPRLLKRTL